MNAADDLSEGPVQIPVQELSSAELPASKTEEQLKQNIKEWSKPPAEEWSDAEKQTVMNDYYFEVGF